MTMSDLGAIGELLGGVAVIITIAYLAVQTRQNNRLLKLTGFAQSYEQTWMAWIEVAHEPELAGIMERGYRDPGSLAPNEFQRFSAIMGSIVYGMENALYFYEHGLVDEEIWLNILENSKAYGFFDSPGFIEYTANRPGPVSRRLRRVLSEQYGVDYGAAERGAARKPRPAAFSSSRRDASHSRL